MGCIEGAAQMTELLIGALLGCGLYGSMKRADLSVVNPETRRRAVAIGVGFAVVATGLLELTDALTR